MKQFFTHLLLTQLLLLVCSAISAKPVTEQQARQKALEFIQSKSTGFNAQRSVLRRVQGLPELTSVSEGEEQPVYMYNIDGGGFVIVSGESSLKDILAYSTNGRIDAANMPPAMKWWLNCCKAAAANLKKDNGITGFFNNQQTRVYEQIAPRITTVWGQMSPYDTYTPRIYYNRGGQQYSVPSLTGCVATALAQVLTYYGYPEKTLQDVESYSDTSRVKIIEGDKNNKDTLYFHGNYQTEKIPANTPLNWNLVRANDQDAIAKLMQYCGAALKMKYSNMVSIADDKNLLRALTNVFGYKDVYVVNQEEYDSLQNWIDRCYLELQYNGPFLMGGTASDGGHQFIVDGYSGGFFYINWGWNGDYNGLFYLDILNPYSWSDRSYGYNAEVTMIAGMGANGKSHKDMKYMHAIWSDNMIVAGNELKNHVYKRDANGTFTLPVTWVGETKRYLHSEYIPSLVFCDEKNKPVKYLRLNDNTCVKGEFGVSDTIQTEFSFSLDNGTYRIYAGYALPDSNNVYFCMQGEKHPVAIKVEDDYVTANNGTDVDQEQRHSYKGEKNCFVLLVQFDDVQFSLPNPQEFFNRLCNEKGFNGSNTLYPTTEGRGSVSDYFYDQSDGRFKVNFEVLPIITLDKKQEYYGADNPLYEKDYDYRVDEMVTEALQAIDGKIDFNKFCWDETKKEVTNFYIVTPRTSQASNVTYTTLLWPSRRKLNKKFVSDDGITLENYAYGTELTGSYLDDKGKLNPKLSVDGPGTMCHEFSHCLGFADHYDSMPGEYGEVQAVGNFDIMGRGCNNGNGWIPAGYSGYERQIASWIDFIELDLDKPQIIENVKPVNRGGDCYVVRNPLNVNEFFTIEVREKSKWDIALPDSGLMITYINYNKTRWDYNNVNNVNKFYSYPGLRILSPEVPVDSIYKEPKKLYHTGDSLTNYTDPYSFICTNNPYDQYGRNLHVSITDIVEHDDGTISFNWMHCSNPTNIQGVIERRDERPYDDAYYTLDGRRLSTKPQHGIYIHRGKKIYIR